MALRFMDSCEGVNTSQLQGARIYSGSTLTSATVLSTGGRYGGQGYQCTGGLSLYLTFDNQATWIVGGYFKTPAAWGNGTILSFWDGATCQCSFIVTGTGQVVCKRGTGGGTTLGTSAGALATSTWYYLEFKVTINNTTGTMEMRTNGSSFISLTAQNNRASANNQANIVRFGYDTAQNWTGTWVLDDIVIMDGNGSPNSYLGEKRIYAISPTGAGTTTQLTPNGAANNWDCVDEAIADDDTTYVASATANNLDTYALADLPPGLQNISGVGVRCMAGKSDAGARSVTPMVRTGGTNYAGTTQALTTSYADYQSVWATNPNTTSAWAASDVNALEAGVRVD